MKVTSTTPVSAEVEAYDPLIQEYARQHGIPEYVELIKAVMMQESGGQGNDPMQASECGIIHSTQIHRMALQTRNIPSMLVSRI